MRVVETAATERGEFPGLTTVAVGEVLAALQDGDSLAPAKRVVLEWFRRLSAGELEDAYALMNPMGRYWVLRQRNTFEGDLVTAHDPHLRLDERRMTSGALLE